MYSFLLNFIDTVLIVLIAPTCALGGISDKMSTAPSKKNEWDLLIGGKQQNRMQRLHGAFHMQATCIQ